MVVAKGGIEEYIQVDSQFKKIDKHGDISQLLIKGKVVIAGIYYI